MCAHVCELVFDALVEADWQRPQLPNPKQPHQSSPSSMSRHEQISQTDRRSSVFEWSNNVENATHPLQFAIQCVVMRCENKIPWLTGSDRNDKRAYMQRCEWRYAKRAHRWSLKPMLMLMVMLSDAIAQLCVAEILRAGAQKLLAFDPLVTLLLPATAVWIFTIRDCIDRAATPALPGDTFAATRSAVADQTHTRTHTLNSCETLYKSNIFYRIATTRFAAATSVAVWVCVQPCRITLCFCAKARFAAVAVALQTHIGNRIFLYGRDRNINEHCSNMLFIRLTVATTCQCCRQKNSLLYVHMRQGTPLHLLHIRFATWLAIDKFFCSAFNRLVSQKTIDRSRLRVRIRNVAALVWVEVFRWFARRALLFICRQLYFATFLISSNIVSSRCRCLIMLFTMLPFPVCSLVCVCSRPIFMFIVSYLYKYAFTSLCLYAE